jgi:hypothetical protein
LEINTSRGFWVDAAAFLSRLCIPRSQKLQDCHLICQQNAGGIFYEAIQILCLC